MNDTSRSGRVRRHRFRRAIFAPPTVGGTIGALVFWWLSLSPSLLPRDWTMQAAVSAVCLAIGYLLGTWVGWAYHAILHRRGRTIGPGVRRTVWLVLGAIVALVVIAGLALWTPWQNDQRALVQLADVSPFLVLPMALVTALLGALLIVIGRCVGHGLDWLDRFWSRRVPLVAAHAITAVLGVAIFFVVFNKVAVDSFFDWANGSFSTFDTETPPGVVAADVGQRLGQPRVARAVEHPRLRGPQLHG